MSRLTAKDVHALSYLVCYGGNHLPVLCTTNVQTTYVRQVHKDLDRQDRLSRIITVIDDKKAIITWIRYLYRRLENSLEVQIIWLKTRFGK